ncbi:nuclear transport factor 2 family protein [Burkholderia arboris]|uniref:Nuclear transport factor 2 family protein n=1 Tax=Burkholderia arboris TaxID=488730 RepID=A0ABZ3DSF1_9BURK
MSRVRRVAPVQAGVGYPVVLPRKFLDNEIQMIDSPPLSSIDRFEIFEQLHRHQRYIDNDASRASAELYVSLYWPEATFTVNDIRENTFTGADGLKLLYDYAHSVFPMDRMRHSLGTFVIEGDGRHARVEWNWIVTWRAGAEGFLSTGTYFDKFEKRDGIWKCLERISHVDANWPAETFQPWVDRQDQTFKAS